MGRTNASDKVLTGFESKVSILALQKGYKLWRPTKRAQIYRLDGPQIVYVLFVKVSILEHGWWGIGEGWLDKINEALKDQMYKNWAVVLLKSPERGFLLLANDFMNILKEGGFYHGGKVFPQIEMHEKNMPFRFEFRGLETFLEMLNL